jgi:hypothetical protein
VTVGRLCHGVPVRLRHPSPSPRPSPCERHLASGCFFRYHPLPAPSMSIQPLTPQHHHHHLCRPRGLRPRPPPAPAGGPRPSPGPHRLHRPASYAGGKRLPNQFHAVVQEKSYAGFETPRGIFIKARLHARLHSHKKVLLCQPSLNMQQSIFSRLLLYSFARSITPRLPLSFLVHVSLLPSSLSPASGLQLHCLSHCSCHQFPRNKLNGAEFVES